MTLEDRTEDGHVTKVIQLANRSALYDTTTAITAKERSVETLDQASEDYHRLYLLDIEMHARLRNVTNAMNQLDSAGGQDVLMVLTEEYNWMSKVQEEVRDTQVGGDRCNEALRYEFLQSLHDIRDTVRSIMDVMGRRTKEDLNSASATVNTGEIHSINRNAY